MFVVGGLGGSNSGNHVPTLYSCVARLSERYAITVYSQSRVGAGAHVGRCGKAIVKHLSVDRSTNPISRGYTFLSEFFQDHAKEPFQMVHAFWGLPCGLYALYAGRMKRLQVIVSLMGGETAALGHIGYGRLRSFPHRPMMMCVLRHSRTLVVQSEFQATELISLGMNEERISIIPCGVVWRTRIHKKRRMAPPYRFLYVGTLNEVKAPENLLRTFEIIANNVKAKLRIIGEGHLENKLRSMANDLTIGRRTDFLGFIPHNQLRRHYQWADVLLQTSLHEGGGASVLEAMQNGVLVCGTRVGFVADFEDKAAQAAAVGDCASLADKVLKLIHDESRQRLLRPWGQQWSAEHDVDWTVERYSHLYESRSSSMNSGL